MKNSTKVKNSKNNQSKTVAFFDLDNTIIVGTNSLSLYVKYLVKNGQMSSLNLIKGSFYALLHKIDLFNLEKLLDKFIGPYKGKTHQEILALSRHWFQTEVCPLLSIEAIDCIQKHQDLGHTTVLLSAASQYVCLPVKDYLGLDESIHSLVDVKGGKLTGSFAKPLCYREGKVLYADRFLNEWGGNWKNAYFYTDSITDLPVLETVGHPVTVNPDPLLKRAAKKNHWPILFWQTPQKDAKDKFQKAS